MDVNIVINVKLSHTVNLVHLHLPVFVLYNMDRFEMLLLDIFKPV